MSASLYWYYAVSQPVSEPMRKILEKRTDVRNGTILSNYDVEFLKGCDMAGVDGARYLIDAVETHGEIYLRWEE